MPISFQPFLQRAEVARWSGVILLIGTALLYGATLDNGLQPEELIGGDLITHQYAQVQARPSNAPGYPLYTLGGWLWFHGLRSLLHLFGQPLPNPIPILSSYSTLWALLALWLLYRILCHITRSAAWPGGNWPLAWLISTFYAVTYFFWYYATTTEQYSSAVAQTLAIVYVYLLWQEQTSTGPIGHPGVRNAEWATLRIPHSAFRIPHLFLLAFLCGLSLAHMLTVAFIAPPLVIVVVWQAPKLLRDWRVWIGVLIATALPLLSYFYVYLRGAVHPEWWGEGDWRTAQEWFWAFVSTAQGREELGWGFEPGRAFFGNSFPHLIWQELSLPLLLVGLMGIALLGKRLATLLYGTLAIYLLFCWAYRYGNWFQVILPAYPLILLGVGAFLNRFRIGAGNTQDATRNTQHLIYWLSLGLLILAIIWRVDASLPGANSRHRPTDTALERAALLLAEPLPSEANLFAELNDGLALHYLIDIWGVRSDLRVISSPIAAEVLAQGKPVFATWQATPILQSELPPNLSPALQSAGPDWILVQAGEPVRQPIPGQVLAQVLTPEVELVGYSVRPTPALPTGRKSLVTGMDVTLLWRILGDDWPEGISISVRPTLQGALMINPEDGEGGVVQVDNARPAHGLFAKGELSPPLLVSDGYRLPLPTPLPAGADGLQVILYRSTASGFENLAELSLPIP